MLHHLHRDPLSGLPDLDLLVEPPGAVVLAERLGKALADAGRPLTFCRSHPAYGTVELGCGDLLLDLATARLEHYPEPGGNPQVVPGTLDTDLARRDVSVNAMALLLEGDRLRLVDPHGGLADLQRRQLRFLHPGSLRDDPTRLIRAARYGARLGFELEAGSAVQLRSTLAAWPWPRLSAPALGTRLRMELELLLEREPWPRALQLLQAWGALPLLDAELQRDPALIRRIRWGHRLGVTRLTALVAGAADPLALAERLQLPHREHRLLEQALRLKQRLRGVALDRAPLDAHGWALLLEQHGWSPEAVALQLACGQGPRRPQLRWWARWRHLQPECNAQQLIAAGLQPGPALGERLRELRAERLRTERC
jgi:poly(A) polymerase